MTLKPASRANARVTPDGIVLLDSDSGAIFTANAVGAAVWTHLTKGTSTTVEIAAAIAEKYGIATDRVLADVEVFAQALLDRGLVLMATDAQQTARRSLEGDVA